MKMNEEKKEYKIIMDKVLKERPDLTEESIFDLTLRELLQIQNHCICSEIEAKAMDVEFQRRCRKFYEKFDTFAKYIPEDVLFKALAKCEENEIWVEKSVTSLNYYPRDYEILKEGTNWTGQKEYTILTSCSNQGYHCDETIVKDILKYYYPTILDLNLSIYSLSDEFDQFFVEPEVDGDEQSSENGECLYVSLIDVIMGDIQPIINANFEKKGCRGANFIADRNNFFKQDHVKRFLDIIQNERNPEAKLLWEGPLE